MTKTFLASQCAFLPNLAKFAAAREHVLIFQSFYWEDNISPEGFVRSNVLFFFSFFFSFFLCLFQTCHLPLHSVSSDLFPSLYYLELCQVPYLPFCISISSLRLSSHLIWWRFLARKHVLSYQICSVCACTMCFLFCQEKRNLAQLRWDPRNQNHTAKNVWFCRKWTQLKSKNIVPGPYLN